MDEDEFKQLLELIPVVRPRDYHVDFDSCSGLSEGELNDASDHHTDKRTKGIDLNDAFWDKLKLVAEKKVYNELSSDAAWKFLNSSRC